MPLLSWLTPIVLSMFRLLGAEHNPRPREIVWREFHSHFVSRQNPDVVHSHLAGNMTQHYMAVFKLDTECCVWKVLQNLTLHLYNVVLGHLLLISLVRSRP